jgi:hypothetical protein
MEKMTIHRALSELKLIDARIEKAVQAVEPVGLMQNDKPVNGLYPKDAFEADTKAKFQSVTDLIDRKIKIKSSIVSVNGKTNVGVAGKSMTIADAITFKTVVLLKQSLVDALKVKYGKVKGKFLTENEKINAVALENAKIMIGKQGDDKVKPTDDDVKAIVEPFVKRNEVHLVDPLGVESLIDKMQTEIDDFTAEVDAVLSEINAVTFIEF